MSIELEPLRIDHAAELVEVLCDERLYEHIGGSPPGEDELRARFARQVAGRSPDGRARWFNWVVREDGVAVGTLQATVAGDLAELAWVVGIPYRGRGVAARAGTAAMELLRVEGVRRFIAHIAPANAASEAVARRLG